MKPEVTCTTWRTYVTSSSCSPLHGPPTRKKSGLLSTWTLFGVLGAVGIQA
jgi:hypothetical protein